METAYSRTPLNPTFEEWIEWKWLEGGNMK